MRLRDFLSSYSYLLQLIELLDFMPFVNIFVYGEEELTDSEVLSSDQITNIAVLQGDTFNFTHEDLSLFEKHFINNSRVYDTAEIRADSLSLNGDSCENINKTYLRDRNVLSYSDFTSLRENAVLLNYGLRDFEVSAVNFGNASKNLMATEDRLQNNFENYLLSEDSLQENFMLVRDSLQANYGTAYDSVIYSRTQGDSLLNGSLQPEEYDNRELLNKIVNFPSFFNFADTYNESSLFSSPLTVLSTYYSYGFNEEADSLKFNTAFEKATQLLNPSSVYEKQDSEYKLGDIQTYNRDLILTQSKSHELMNSSITNYGDKIQNININVEYKAVSGEKAENNGERLAQILVKHLKKELVSYAEGIHY